MLNTIQALTLSLIGRLVERLTLTANDLSQQLFDLIRLITNLLLLHGGQVNIIGWDLALLGHQILRVRRHLKKILCQLILPLLIVGE